MKDIEVFFKDSRNMEELEDGSVDLVVSSPPYFQMRGDCSFDSYEEYLDMIGSVLDEVKRVLRPGRLVAFNLDDYGYEGEKYPVVHDVFSLMRERLNYIQVFYWIKPVRGLNHGGVMASGVFFQNPYPFYYYPKGLVEPILVFQKGKFSFEEVRKEVPDSIKEASKMNPFGKEYGNFNCQWWYMQSEIETGKVKDSNGRSHSSTFPLQLPYLLISYYSYVGDRVLDPFCGSANTLVAAKMLRRKGVGYEKYKVSPNGTNYEEIIKKKLKMGNEELETWLDEGSMKPMMAESVKTLDDWR